MKYPNFSDLMGSNDRKLTPLVTETLGEILDKVSTLESRDSEINILMHTCLRTVISCVVNRPSLTGNNDVDTKAIENMRSNLANLIALLHEMTPTHYSNYIDHFKISEGTGRPDLIDFVMEIFVLFKDLIEHPVFPQVNYLLTNTKTW